ncbi:9478_t:CDS:10 [Paraglomus brasilianum]|uniref:9478_t:CDS:1 n=1 Tax=Paraglomus brasilianum TaxID=144538 RepID=A0A9N9BDK5_9GLOM|nr:9478_t:CDS:10 [Paraglomus brasilianum]
MDLTDKEYTQKIARKEWRKLRKKQRKKAARVEAAKLRQKLNEEEEKETDEEVKLRKAEETQHNSLRILWEYRERQIEEANARRMEEERRKKIVQENWEKAIKSIKVQQKPIAEHDSKKNNLDEQHNVTPDETDSALATEYGTDKDPINCSFYLKTGACRYGDSCARMHTYPDKSVTVLIKNMYQGMPVNLADEENDDNLEYDEVEAERHFAEFFEDIHAELQKYGKIVQLKVCNNFEPHLRGNVYVQYSKENSAEKAVNEIRGRWYAGKQLIAEYCPVKKWKLGICGFYDKNKCPRGIHCNFLHVFKNPQGLYSEADNNEFENTNRTRSDSVLSINTNNTKPVQPAPLSATHIHQRDTYHRRKHHYEHHSDYYYRHRRNRSRPKDHDDSDEEIYSERDWDKKRDKNERNGRRIKETKRQRVEDKKRRSRKNEEGDRVDDRKRIGDKRSKVESRERTSGNCLYDNNISKDNAYALRSPSRASQSPSHPPRSPSYTLQSPRTPHSPS